MSSTALVLPIAGSTTPVDARLGHAVVRRFGAGADHLLLGALARHAGGADWPNWRKRCYGALVVAILMVFGRYFLPHLFAQAARTKSPELFLSASLLVVIVASLATAGVGLSPIVGALIAGLLIAETEYHTEVEGITAPLQGAGSGDFPDHGRHEHRPGRCCEKLGCDPPPRPVSSWSRRWLQAASFA
jgi:CPA2 family monovalent cation:H+ antiporter-2